MTGELRSELLKMRSTRTNFGLIAGLLVLVVFIVLIAGLTADRFDLLTEDDQWGYLAVGGIGAIFAALIGVMSVTSEYRHGTIRPTFVFTPRRERVVGAKLGASLLMGLVLGVVSEGVAFWLGVLIIRARGFDFALSDGRAAQLVLGTLAVSALWAALGAGVGAVLRNQVAAVIAVIVWVFVVENILLNVIPDVGRFMPGPAGTALTGGDAEELLAPAVGGLVLVGWVAVAAVAAVVLTRRRDVN